MLNYFVLLPISGVEPYLFHHIISSYHFQFDQPFTSFNHFKAGTFLSQISEILSHPPPADSIYFISWLPKSSEI